jgi:hypothetical protein
MRPMTFRRASVVAVTALGLLTAAACSDKATGDIDKPSPDGVVVAPAGAPFASRFFDLPLTVTPPPILRPGPIDAAGLLAWQSSATEEKKIRFMLPAQIYRPGKATAEAPPKDYLGYLQSLTASGTKLTATKKTQVDGHPATLLTILGSGTTDVAGSLGCPEHGGDKVDDCFGPQPDLLIRMAVIDLGDKTLLSWSRVPATNPDQTFIDSFEQMLATVHFR